jgi:hypothetical protein
MRILAEPPKLFPNFFVGRKKTARRLPFVARIQCQREFVEHQASVKCIFRHGRRVETQNQTKPAKSQAMQNQA